MALSVFLLAATLTTTKTFKVPEDRGHPKARTIALHAVILPATKLATREPLFILQGGPGQAATTLTDFYAETFAGIREDREIVLIDQRGTGQSNGLKCDMGPGPDLFPVDRVEACAKELSSRADFRHYTTADAVRDLDDVRRALGWKQINLYGTSYGTRVALEYARAYPAHVRSIIVKGTLPPQMRYSIDPALDTQASFEKVAALAPSVKDDLARLLPNDAVAVELRNFLHSIPSIEALPSALHDPARFEKSAAAHRAAFSRELSLGMYFSVVCAEDVWRASDAAVAKATAGTIAGDYWHRQLAGACKVWPHAPPQRSVATPFRSRVPSLIISGAFDPVTPPRMGALMAKNLVNSRHVVIANASHSFARLGGCVDVIMAKFVIDPDPAKVDESCTAAIAPPKFND